MELTEKQLNVLIEHGLSYLITSGDDISELNNVIDELLPLPKSTTNLIIKLCEKAIYNNKIKVDKKGFLDLRNKIRLGKTK